MPQLLGALVRSVLDASAAGGTGRHTRPLIFPSHVLVLRRIGRDHCPVACQVKVTGTMGILVEPGRRRVDPIIQ